MNSNGSRIRILREAFVHGLGTLLSQFISAVRGLIVAGLLGPAQYGLWKSIQVGLDCLAYTHLGVLHGMARLLPVYKKRADEKSITTAQRLTLAVTVATWFAVGLMTVLVARVLRPNLSSLWMAVILLLFLMQLIRFQIMTCQAFGYFWVLAMADVTMAIIGFVVMLVAVPRWGVYGVLIGLGVGATAALTIGLFSGVFPSRGCAAPFKENSFRNNVLRDLIRVGFPFMFVDGLFVLWQRMDRTVLVFFFGAESRELGWYGLAVMVASFALQMPQILSRVLFRRTVGAFDSEGISVSDLSGKLKAHLDLPVLATAGAGPLCFGSGMILSWWLVRIFLPEYTGSLVSIAFLMLASYWTSIGLSVRNLFTATDHQWQLAGIYTTAVFVSVGVLYTGCRFGLGIAGSRVAVGGLGMLAGSIVFAVLSLLTTASFFGDTWRRRGALLSRVMIPFLIYASWTGWAVHTLNGHAPEMRFGVPEAFWEMGTCLTVNTPIALWSYFSIVSRLRN